jgi:hypothetical protein
MDEERLIEAGFTPKQAEILLTMFAGMPHSHSMDEIDGLEEVLEGLEDNDEDEDED